MAAVVALVCTAPQFTAGGIQCARGAQAWQWLGSAGITRSEFIPVAGAVATVLLVGAAFRVALRLLYNR